MAKHPRDTYLTVYGRKPVLELLSQKEALQIAKVLIAQKAKGGIIKEIIIACEKAGIPYRRVSATEVSRISKHPKQDQGVVADVIATGMDHAARYFAQAPQQPDYWLALDGVTTPANVGLIIRSATALGMGVLLPLRGSSKINPLVIKASAGTVFRSRLLKCKDLQEALPLAKAANYTIYGLAGEEGQPIASQQFKKHAIFVMGNESRGVDEQLRPLIDAWLTIPMQAGVESLNVACAATIVAYEVARQKL